MRNPEPECLTALPENARRETRKHVLLGGKVVYRGGAVSLDCTILDLSASGARIRIGRGQAIPSRFHLIDIRNRVAYDAAVVWLNPPLAGLRFEVGYPLGNSLPTELGYLRTLWIECAIR